MRNEIKQLASQLQVLIPHTKPQFTLYNFAFGALYAFARAIELKFDEQYRQEATNNMVSSQRAREVQQLATDLSQTGKLPPGGRWLAGHYYNSALLRVDVCYEQAVRYYLTRQPTDNMSEALVKSLRLGFPPGLIVPFWPKVRRQVNSLKHKSIIQTEGPAMPPTELLTVIEKLIKSVEWLFTYGPAPREPGGEKY